MRRLTAALLLLLMVFVSGSAMAGVPYRTFTLGFPFECIKAAPMQTSIMQAILNYIINN